MDLILVVQPLKSSKVDFHRRRSSLILLGVNCRLQPRPPCLQLPGAVTSESQGNAHSDERDAERDEPKFFYRCQMFIFHADAP
jgi:hypothetical protein